MTVDLLGVRLLLQLGKTLPMPAPAIVTDALRSLEVQSSHNGRDTFQMTFAVARDTPIDASLIGLGLLEPPNRLVATLIFGALPEVLIDGIITHVEFSVAPTGGASVLHVTGEDLSVMMDLEEKNQTFPVCPDSVIVTRLLLPYAARYQIVPAVTATTNVPLPTGRMPSQQGTDLSHIRALAERNGYIFYLEPLTVGLTRAYWGPDAPTGAPQPAINVGFLDGHRAAQSALNGRFDALSAATPKVSVTEPNTGVELPLELPSLLAVPPVLRPATPLRKSIARKTAGLDPATALLEGVADAARGSDAVRLSGEVDGVRYGNVLRSRKLVGIRGMGLTWDGLYTVDQVTHRLQPGGYSQSFALKRSGFVSASPLVVP